MAALYLFILITCFVQISFFLFIYTRYLNMDVSPAKLDNLNLDKLPPVSVVICAKNEAENIKKYLPVVMDQVYPKYEVIVVDDGSTDGTQEILAEYEDRYENLLSFRIEVHEVRHGGKKQAIMHGISLAKHEWIVVTDADCCPGSNRWLIQMARPLGESADIVLGVSPYFSGGNWLKLFFRAESLFVALQYLNFALSGLPYMGVGRNMAYKKKVFEKHDLEKHWDLLSGDDDLFINEMADSNHIEICANMDAYTYSEGPESVGQWFRQKIRHYSTGYRYNLLQKIWLGYYWLSSLLLYVLIPVSFAFFAGNLTNGAYLIAILLITAGIRWVVLVRSLRKLGEHNISFSVPIFDLAYILSVWIISPLSRWGRNQWK
jgi:glycosyltransferase involved in cell wall biosynthesis